MFLAASEGDSEKCSIGCNLPAHQWMTGSPPGRTWRRMTMTDVESLAAVVGHQHLFSFVAAIMWEWRGDFCRWDAQWGFPAWLLQSHSTPHSFNDKRDLQPEIGPRAARQTPAVKNTQAIKRVLAPACVCVCMHKSPGKWICRVCVCVCACQRASLRGQNNQPVSALYGGEY